MAPTLPEALEALAREGVTAIRVVPVFLALGGHLKDDLPRLVEAARTRFPSLSIDVDAPIGEQDAVLEAIAARIAGQV